jgi:hypothetical protein
MTKCSSTSASTDDSGNTACRMPVVLGTGREPSVTLSCLHPHTAANEPVPLLEGSVRIPAAGDTEAEGTGALVLRWLPSPGLRLEAELSSTGWNAPHPDARVKAVIEGDTVETLVSSTRFMVKNGGVNDERARPRQRPSSDPRALNDSGGAGEASRRQSHYVLPMAMLPTSTQATWAQEERGASGQEQAQLSMPAAAIWVRSGDAEYTLIRPPGTPRQGHVPRGGAPMAALEPLPPLVQLPSQELVGFERKSSVRSIPALQGSPQWPRQSHQQSDAIPDSLPRRCYQLPL